MPFRYEVRAVEDGYGLYIACNDYWVRVGSEEFPTEQEAKTYLERINFLNVKKHPTLNIKNEISTLDFSSRKQQWESVTKLIHFSKYKFNALLTPRNKNKDIEEKIGFYFKGLIISHAITRAGYYDLFHRSGALVISYINTKKQAKTICFYLASLFDWERPIEQIATDSSLTEIINTIKLIRKDINILYSSDLGSSFLQNVIKGQQSPTNCPN